MPEAIPDFVYTIYIAAPPERVWSALTDHRLTRDYWGHENRSDWKQGSRWEMVRNGNGAVDVVGKVIEIDPPRRLVVSWVDPQFESEPGRTSRVTYELAENAGDTRLTVLHSELPNESVREAISGGWPMVLSSMKSLLEKGNGLASVTRRIEELA